MKQTIEIHDNENGIYITTTSFDELNNFQGSDDTDNFDSIGDAKAALKEMIDDDDEDWELVRSDEYSATFEK